MNFELSDICSLVSSLEKNLIQNSKSNIISSYEHWNILNTVNHVCSWQNNAINKVENRLKGIAVNYHSTTTTIEQVNLHYYEKTKNYSKQKTFKFIDEVDAKIRTLATSINGKETLKELAPSGFDGTVFDYLKMDLIYHPINHYIYYSLKNDEYDNFNLIEKLISQTRQSVFNDLGVIDFEYFMESEMYDLIIKKGYEWKNNDLYIYIANKLHKQ